MELVEIYCCSGALGGEWLRFGEIITAVATGTVIYVLLSFVFLAAFVPTVGSYWGSDVASIVSLLVASLIVGYVFAGQIQEARMSSISRIAILSTVVLMFGTIIAFAANGYYSTVVQEVLQDMYSTSGWTTMDWYVYSQMAMVMMVAVNVVLALVFSFIGLYAGSMLKRSAKT
jgi:hypothetical protein